MTDQIDRQLDQAIKEARAFVSSRPAPDVSDGVMRSVERIGVVPAQSWVYGGLRGLWKLTWTPRRVELQWRPAYALAAGALALVLLIYLPYPGRTPVGAQQLFVQFRLEAAGAMDVRLAGSFTNWQPQYALHETSPGVWTITVPLSPGVHDYGFVVDGRRWVADPYAVMVDDGFGGVNSRIALVPPDSPRL